MPKRTRLLALLLAATCGAAVILSLVPMTRGALPPRQGPPLNAATSWGYQLQRLDPKRVPAAADVLVIDYSRDGSQKKAWSAEAIEALRQRGSGRPRIVLAYLSIGEAESYRYYWQPQWGIAPPSWLGNENKEWQENYPVRYWEPAWQRIISNPSPSLLTILLESQIGWMKPYLDRVLEAGFDGVYLDRVDVYDTWKKSHRDAEADMMRFVAALSAYAKARKPGFLIVPQNGEELLRHAEYRKVIDGVAKEDLFYGVDGDESENSDEDVSRSTELLRRARQDGLPVLVVEYLRDAEKRAEVQRRLGEEGFLPLFARRDLNVPPELPPALAKTAPISARVNGKAVP